MELIVFIILRWIRSFGVSREIVLVIKGSSAELVCSIHVSFGFVLVGSECDFIVLLLRVLMRDLFREMVGFFMNL